MPNPKFTWHIHKYTDYNWIYVHRVVISSCVRKRWAKKKGKTITNRLILVIYWMRHFRFSAVWELVWLYFIAHGYNTFMNNGLSTNGMLLYTANKNFEWFILKKKLYNVVHTYIIINCMRWFYRKLNDYCLFLSVSVYIYIFRSHMRFTFSRRSRS